MATNIFGNFVAGVNAGEKIRNAWDQRKAGQAMADLYNYDPMASQDQGAQPAAGAQRGFSGFGGGGGSGGFTEQAGTPGQPDQQDQQGQQGNGVQQSAQQQQKLPSTRDWISLRTAALESAGALGPEAAKNAMDEIDQVQQKGALSYLYRAKTALEDGNTEAAGKFWEAANSYVGNFTTPDTAVAKMKDGSTQVGFVMQDEQTGQPLAPGMMLTPKVLDHFIDMAENPKTFGKLGQDRKMAEQQWNRKTYESDRNFERKAYESDRNYGRKAYESDRGYNLDVAKAQARQESKPVQYKAKDYTDALGFAMKQYVDPTTGLSSISDEQRNVIMSKMSQARANPQLKNIAPDQLSQFVVSNVMAGKR